MTGTRMYAGKAGIIVMLLLGCTESPSDPPQRLTAPTAEQNRAIFETARNYDAELVREWHTIVIHDGGRTSTRATVSLFSKSGAEWQYELTGRTSEWNVQSTATVRPATIDQRGGGITAHSTSTTDPIVVGRGGATGSFGTDYLNAHFAPIEGTVSTLIDAGTNSIDFFEWMHSGSGWSDITFDERTWEVKFDSWFPCYNKFFVEGTHGFHCEWVYQDDFNVFFADAGGSSVEASHAFLTYHSSAVEEMDTDVASVIVSPDPFYLSFGATADVTATAYNAAQQALSGKSAEWAVEHGEYATIQSTGAMSGRITGVGLGTTTVLASVDGQVGGALVTVDPTVSASGPSYDYQGSVTVEAGLTPAGGSYYFEWDITYCVADEEDPHCFSTESYNGNSGQDEDSQGFTMQPTYEWARFEVSVRPTAGARLLATDTWTVDGAGELPDCHLGVCPEGGGGGRGVSGGHE